MSATYLYHGIPGWRPGPGTPPVPDGDPGLTAADIARLAGVADSAACLWVRKDGFPAPQYRPWARHRAWPEEAVRAWLAPRGLLRDKSSTK